MERSIIRGWNLYLKARGESCRECPFDLRAFIIAVIGAMRGQPDAEKLSGPAGAWPLLLQVDLDAAAEALIRLSEFECLDIWNCLDMLKLAPRQFANGENVNGN